MKNLLIISLVMITGVTFLAAQPSKFRKRMNITTQKGNIYRAKSGSNFDKIGGKGINGIKEEGDWITPFKLDPSDPNRMIAGFENLWLSTNVKIAIDPNAVAWIKVTNFKTDGNKIIDVAFAHSDSDIVYLARQNGDGKSHLHLTKNLSSSNPTWTNITLNSNLGEGGLIKDIEVHRKKPDVVWIVKGKKVYRSKDFGATWIDYSGTLPDNVSINTIVCDQSSNKEELYLGNDFGVYYRNKDMTDWQVYTEGLPPVEVTELEIYYGKNRDRNVLRAGTYGRGLWQTKLRCRDVPLQLVKRN